MSKKVEEIGISIPPKRIERSNDNKRKCALLDEE